MSILQKDLWWHVHKIVGEIMLEETPSCFDGLTTRQRVGLTNKYIDELRNTVLLICISNAHMEMEQL